MKPRSALVTPFQVYLFVVVAFSALIAGISARDLLFGAARDNTWLVVGLSLVIGFTTARLVELRPNIKISTRAAPQYAAIVLLSPAGAIIATAAGVIVGYFFHLMRGRHNRIDLLFNTAQGVLSTWVATSIYRLVLSAAGTNSGEPVALIFAAASLYMANAFLIAVAVTLSRQNTGLFATFLHLIRNDPLVYTALLVTGLLAILMVREQQFWVVPLLIVPLAMTEHVVVKQRKENERDRKIAVMEEVDTLRGEFVAAVTHDLRTPLMTIKGFGELLEDREDELMPDERTAVRAINTSAERLGELVETLLQLSELDAGMVVLETRPSDISNLVRRVFEHLRYTADNKGIGLVMEASGPPPPVVLDPIRFEQVITNIVSNAIKFSPAESKVVVRTGVLDETLTVQISDSGPGIAPEALPHIFERFYRASQVEAGRRQTGGLGLAIAKSIVELHGGTIWAESVVRQGSTFTIHVPVCRTNSSDDGPVVAQFSSPRSLPNQS